MLVLWMKCCLDFERLSSQNELCKEVNMMNGSVELGACNVQHPLRQGNYSQLHYYALGLLQL